MIHQSLFRSGNHWGSKHGGRKISNLYLIVNYRNALPSLNIRNPLLYLGWKKDRCKTNLKQYLEAINQQIFIKCLPYCRQSTDNIYAWHPSISFLNVPIPYYGASKAYCPPADPRIPWGSYYFTSLNKYFNHNKEFHKISILKHESL